MSPEAVVGGEWLSEDGSVVAVVVEHGVRVLAAFSERIAPSTRLPYHDAVRRLPPAEGDDWFGLCTEPLPVDAVLAWAERPWCGAVVLFTGVVRDHAEGRDDVRELEYEAYEEAAGPRLAAIASEARTRWPAVARIAMLHRVGRLAIGEPAVVVVVSSPHRGDAFDAARFAIDTLKATVPIWKKETWAGGSDWGTDAQAVSEVGS
jgi:molybdopterin synthase catalytic subunit